MSAAVVLRVVDGQAEALPPLTPQQRQIGQMHRELVEARAEIGRLTEALRACHEWMPTGCDRPDPTTCRVEYCAADWPAVVAAEKRAGAILRGEK